MYHKSKARTTLIFGIAKDKGKLHEGFLTLTKPSAWLMGTKLIFGFNCVVKI